MVQYCNKKSVTIEVGHYVLINIPKVDHEPLDTQNINGKVIDKKKIIFTKLV